MKITEGIYKSDNRLTFICAVIIITGIITGIIDSLNYSTKKEIKKEVQEQQRNDYSDALIKNCELYNK